MNARILSLKTSEKKSACVTLIIECGEERRKYTVSEGTYRKIGCPLSGETVEEEILSQITEEDEMRRAMKKALGILSYADNSEKNLYRKMLISGFSKKASEAVCRECVSLGYIDEERQIERLVIRAHAELIGKQKIVARLAARFYSPQKILAVISSLEERGEVDFKKSKEELLEKLPPDAGYEEKRKLLSKYGYLK